jgi:enoyl-CoA hydratase/carnithine racemase
MAAVPRCSTAQARVAAGEMQAVAVTGKPFIFAAGADLSGVPSVTGASRRTSPRLGHDGVRKLMDMGVPTFAFINGLALGGGLEVNLLLHLPHVPRRAPAFALPECFLGLVPGWGGTFLVPNLIGSRQGAVKVIIENPLS